MKRGKKLTFMLMLISVQMSYARYDYQDPFWTLVEEAEQHKARQRVERAQVHSYGQTTEDREFLQGFRFDNESWDEGHYDQKPFYADPVQECIINMYHGQRLPEKPDKVPTRVSKDVSDNIDEPEGTLAEKPVEQTDDRAYHPVDSHYDGYVLLDVVDSSNKRHEDWFINTDASEHGPSLYDAGEYLDRSEEHEEPTIEENSEEQEDVDEERPEEQLEEQLIAEDPAEYVSYPSHISDIPMYEREWTHEYESSVAQPVQVVPVSVAEPVCQEEPREFVPMPTETDVPVVVTELPVQAQCDVTEKEVPATADDPYFTKLVANVLESSHGKRLADCLDKQGFIDDFTASLHDISACIANQMKSHVKPFFARHKSVMTMMKRQKPKNAIGLRVRFVKNTRTVDPKKAVRQLQKRCLCLKTTAGVGFIKGLHVVCKKVADSMCRMSFFDPLTHAVVATHLNSQGLSLVIEMYCGDCVLASQKIV